MVEWLRKADPKDATLFDTAEVWPNINQSEEGKLQQALQALTTLSPDKVTQQLAELEKLHAQRRGFIWHKLGMSPFASALEPLAELAALCQTTPGAPSLEAYAEFYVNTGWRVDAAAIATMAACGSPEQHGAILDIVRTVYLPWVDNTARHLQQLIRDSGHTINKRAKPLEAVPGRLVLFADGLRMDVAQQLVQELGAAGIDYTQDWEWSTIPSVTATAKPAASPIADAVQGGDASDEFSTRLRSTGQLLNQDRFIATLKSVGWQYLKSDEIGDPTGSAWTEAGALDKRGHTEGWKLARSVAAEVSDLASRIAGLVRAGWTELVVVTKRALCRLAACVRSFLENPGSTAVATLFIKRRGPEIQE